MCIINIKNLIFQFDPTYHNIHKDNLKFLQKQWSIKYINKNTGSWGWDITCSAAMLHGNPKCDVYESIAYTTYSGLTDSLYDAKNLYKLNFNRCQKICRDLNHKYSNYLKNIGHSDITHLINFKLLEKIARKVNLKKNGLTTQRNFLINLGILQRAEIISKNLSFVKKSNIFYI